jgi:hypothetical protein
MRLIERNEVVNQADFSERLSPQACARAVWAERYAQAPVVFLAGSVVRGEHTESSDLDLVIVYESLHHAYRESFFAHGWPIEAFVHDRQTLQYFFASDRAEGLPTLASMIADGIELPEKSTFSADLKRLAADVLHAGPPPWTEKDLSLSRYLITDVIEDLRTPRSTAELQASVAQLHQMLATHFCRSHGLWTAKGKAIVRRLQQIDSSFADSFSFAFRCAWSSSDTAPLIALCETTLARDGGFLFDGYRADAPESWRSFE